MNGPTIPGPLRNGPVWFFLLALSAAFASASATGPYPSVAFAASNVTFRDMAAGDNAGITYRRQRSPSDAIFEALIQKGVYTFDDQLATPFGSRGVPGVAIFDFDNDGDLDLYVTNGPGAANSLYSNQLEETGRLTFVDVATAAGVDAFDQDSTGTCFGDIDNDGDQDLLVLGNGHPARLFENRGDGTFQDITSHSRIDTSGMHSVSCSMGDVDGDGLLDIVIANTTDWTNMIGLMVEPFALNEPNQLFLNTGGNVFTDVSATMDMFVTNIGDYAPLEFFPSSRVVHLGDWTSRWFLGQADGTFADPGVGDLIGTPFGWGASMIDYDNDGDTDIIYYGTLDPRNFMNMENPGVILQNDGSANFVRDATALARSTDHNRRTVHGVAVGDLNDDGFVDIVSVSSMDVPPSVPLVPFRTHLGGPFDPEAVFVPSLTPIGPQLATWNPFPFTDGTLSVELSSADNGNGWAKVKVRGTKGLTGGGRVNRDGIGAVVKMTPENGKPAMRPILGGSSHASQDSLEAVFGLGAAREGTIDVLWPGGVRNRLYRARRFERIVFPEIPCSYAGDWANAGAYRSCVRATLDELVSSGTLSARSRDRFLSSAMKAFADYRKPR